MNSFSTDQADITQHEAGFIRLPSGASISRLPLWDMRHRVFARLGHRPAADVLQRMGMRLPTVEEYAELHTAALHIDPYFLPMPEMVSAAGVPKPWRDASGADSHAMAAYRAENMRSLEWAEQHDDQVFHLLSAAEWSNEPVANVGKHWATHSGVAVLTGWWDASGKPLQYASTAHLGEPEYTDYATTVHAAYDGADRPEIPPPSSVGSRDTDPSPVMLARDVDGTLGERCLYWLGEQFGIDPREIVGPEHNELILSYSEHCRRGGQLLTVDNDGSPLWRGGVPLPAPSDEWPWCAILQSAALLAALRPGETPPHSARVSVRELCEDARTADTLRDADVQPQPGWLAICGRAGQSPLDGNQGHVRRVVRTTAQRYFGLGGNEQNKIVAAWHANDAALAWIDCS